MSLTENLSQLSSKLDNLRVNGIAVRVAEVGLVKMAYTFLTDLQSAIEDRETTVRNIGREAAYLADAAAKGNSVDSRSIASYQVSLNEAELTIRFNARALRHALMHLNRAGLIDDADVDVVGL